MAENKRRASSNSAKKDTKSGNINIDPSFIPYLIYYGETHGKKSVRQLMEKLAGNGQVPEDFARLVEATSDTRITKTAQFGMPSSADVSYYPPRWFSPMLSWVHFYMPTDLKTTLTWIRHWDTFHPLVGNAIDLHTLLTMGKFQIKLDADPTIKRIYEEAWEACGGILFLYDIIREYYLTGEVFYYLKFDPETGLFVDALPIPPEDIYIDKQSIFQYGKGVEFKLQISQRDFNPEINSLDKMLLDRMPAEVIDAINRNEPLPLPSQFLFVIQRKQSPYQMRGISLVLRVMKDLLYEDKIRESQYAIAQRQINPKEIWKIGSDTFPATQDQIDQLAQMLQTAEQNPMFTLVTKHTVSAEYLFGNQGLSPLKEEFDWIENRVLSAMFTNKAIVHGEGPTYANATIAYRAMVARYLSIRALIERALIEKFFRPIADLHGFYKTTPAELDHRIQRPFTFREPILPTFDWGGTRSALLEGRDMFQTMKDLRGLGLPLKFIFDLVGLDFNYETVLEMKKEEEGTPFDPLYQKFKEKTGSYNIPAPFGSSILSEGEDTSFSTEVKDTQTGEIKEVKLSWPNRQNILSKAKLASLIEEYRREGKPIPLEKIDLLDLD